MEERFTKTRDASESHFWYHGFRRFTDAVLRDVSAGRSDLRIIDCGCGVGQNMPFLEPYGRPIGFELDPQAASAARRFGRPLVRADITRIPFRDNSFDLAVSFDVMQCLDADMAAVREMARVVRPGGYVVVSAAALEVLRADHAEIWQEFRRYTPASLRQLAEAAGLRVERISFVFAALFPLMLAVRFTQRALRPFRSEPSHAEMGTPWAPINTALMALLDAEAALSRYVPMPVGSSLILVAQKPTR
jgi:SAM-dependent methyltransferase